jgi:hypothetical protein
MAHARCPVLPLIGLDSKKRDAQAATGSKSIDELVHIHHNGSIMEALTYAHNLDPEEHS